MPQNLRLRYGSADRQNPPPSVYTEPRSRAGLRPRKDDYNYADGLKHLPGLADHCGDGFLCRFHRPCPSRLALVTNHNRLAQWPDIVAESGIVYAAVGGRVYAVDQESGNGKWRFPLGAPIESGNFKTGVLSTPSMIIAAVDNKMVYGIDKETGAQKWQYISPEKVVGTPVAAGNFVALQLGDSSIMVLNAADGWAAWERPVKFLDGIVGQIAGFRETVIFGTQGDKIYAWDVVTKKQAWVQRLGRFNAEFKPVVYNDNIYCVNSDFLSVISGANGTRRWERNLRGTGKYFASVNQFGAAAVTGDGLVSVFDPSGREVYKKAVDLTSSSTAAPGSDCQCRRCPNRERRNQFDRLEVRGYQVGLCCPTACRDVAFGHDGRLVGTGWWRWNQYGRGTEVCDGCCGSRDRRRRAPAPGS